MSSVSDIKEMIIMEVLSHPPLWQDDHPDYRKKGVAIGLWEEIAVKCGLANGSLAKSKWKSLKDQYRKELRKIPPCLSRDESSNHTKWKYFPLMESIRGSTKTPMGVNEIKMEPTYDALMRTPVSAINSNGGEDGDTDSYESNASVSSKKPRLDVCDHFLSGGCDFDKSKIESTSGWDGEDSGDLHFFKSLLPYFGYFEPLEKLKLMSRIQSLIFEAFQERVQVQNGGSAKADDSIKIETP